MTELYHDAQRRLQDRFDTRRLADRIEERLVHDFIDEDDAEFILGRDMFFLATVDPMGRPNCSYKGGDPGFVRVIDERTLAFPNCAKLVPSEAIAKGTPLLSAPPTCTTTLPVLAPCGTGTEIEVALQLEGVAAVPLKVTVLVPLVVPKLVPVIVTDVPAGPTVGDRLVMLAVVERGTS